MLGQRVFWRHTLHGIVGLLSCSLLLGNADGQEPPDAQAAISTADPEIPVEQLRILVRPLMKAELQVEAEAWIGLLRQLAGRIADLQLQIHRNARGEDPAVDGRELMRQLIALQDQRAALVDRVEVVLHAWKNRGGEVDQYQAYVDQVSSLTLDASDVSQTWSAVVGWVRSKEGGQRWLWNLARFFLILLITYVLAQLASRIVHWLMGRRVRMSQLAKDLLSRTTWYLVMLVGFAIALTALEVDVTPILAAMGAAGFIIGFALQGTLSNFASGLMILINRPFDVGDVVSAGGVTGTVREMNLVSTTFRTFDNQTIHVPNNSIWGNVITNITANDERRVDMEFAIRYDDDFAKAEAIIREVVESHPLVLKQPEPTVTLHELGDSTARIVCRPWAKTGDWWTVKTEITRGVKRRFDESGFSMPAPQTNVRVYQRPDEE